MNKYSDLNENARDILKEIGNIGTGNAITSLSAMINYPISMECPNVRIIAFDRCGEVLGSLEEVAAGVMLEVSGDIKGVFVFLINGTFLNVLLEGLLGMKVENMSDLDLMSRSAVCEIGNIMCCSYLNAMSGLMDLKVDVSVPDLCADMVGSILSVPLIHIANISDELLIIEDKYYIGGQSAISHVLFLPDLDSLERIFHALGEEYET